MTLNMNSQTEKHFPINFGAILSLILGVLLFVVSAMYPSPTKAASCNLNVLTATVQPGSSVQIQIVGSFGGMPKTNATFNVYSPSTGKWVDVGDQISDSGATLSILNDNNGNPLFIDGANTITFRQAGLFGSQTDLCSGSVTISVTPPPLPDTCEACSATNPCKQGLNCLNNKCLPGALPGQGGTGTGCVTNEQCDALNGFTCVGGDNYWCTTNPGTGAGAPGVCTKQTQTGNFNCGNRGGQCAGVVSLTCQGGTTKSQCQGCWINPVDASGANFNETMVGSCVIPDNNGCGSIGGYCCYNTQSNSFSCLQGDIDIEASSGVCKCKENRQPLGGTCTTDAQCQSGSCRSSICSVPTNTCIPGGISPADCALAGGVYCSRPLPNTGTSIDYCCPTQTACNQVAPPSALSSFGGYCNKAGVIGVDTAIGCIPIETLSSFEVFFITWGLGIGGGVVILVLIAGSFQVMTSSGDPAKLESGKGLLISAISGIVMLALSVFMLRVIGVNILGLF